MYAKGLDLVRKGWSFRKAAEHVHLAPSTLWYRFTHQNQKAFKIRKTSLTDKEEKDVIAVLKHYAELGKPLRRKDLMDVVEMLVQSFSDDRKLKLCFKHGRPGRKFCELFEKRHSDKIMFCKPQKQEAQRYRATNASVLIHHFATIEKIINRYNIDARRIINADETGFSAWKEGKNSAKKGYSTRYNRLFTCTATFQNVNRITVLAAVHGNGDRVKQSVADCLPRGAIVTARKEAAAVDSRNFREWAEVLITETTDIRANGRKLLLIYDGYRSHLSIPVLERLSEEGIIAYALPAHTSGTTQPLDVSVFAAFKTRFRSLTEDVINSSQKKVRVLDEFDVCKLITKAYEESFIMENITAGFAKTGIFPLDECRLFSQARPHSFSNPTRIVSVEEMIQMLDEKRSTLADQLLTDVHVLSNGFLDTTYGAVVTSGSAIQALKAQEAKRLQRTRKAEEKEEAAEAELQAIRVQKSVERSAFESYRARKRAKMYGGDVKHVRSLQERRAAARVRFAEEHAKRVPALKSGLYMVQNCREEMSCV